MANGLFENDDNHDENTDYLAELTGPGKKFDRTKYASEQEMYQAIAKGKVEGDRYISFKNKDFDDLKEDFLRIRADNVTKDKLEDLLARREQGLEVPAPQPIAGNVDKPSLDPQDLDAAVERKLLAIEVKRTEKANMEKVETRLRERYGDNAKSVLREKMSTLGISDEDLKFLAKKSPEAVFNALGVNQQPDAYDAPPRSSLRSDNFSPKADLRDAVFYEKMRTTNPKEYFSEKMSIQRLKDMDRPDFLARYNQRQ